MLSAEFCCSVPAVQHNYPAWQALATKLPACRTQSVAYCCCSWCCWNVAAAAAAVTAAAAAAAAEIDAGAKAILPKVV